MRLLILGLALWWAAHLFKRVAPGARARLTEIVGLGPSKGIVALTLAIGLVLIVVGYRGAPFAAVYAPPAWGIHVNNLAMFGAVMLMGLGNTAGRLRTRLRHPMLTGVIVWALAHLLVNGDLASIVLFGALGLWAAVSIGIINAHEPAWTSPEPGPAARDLRLVIVSAVIFAVITTVHAWLGVWPLPG